MLTGQPDPFVFLHIFVCWLNTFCKSWSLCHNSVHSKSGQSLRISLQNTQEQHGSSWRTLSEQQQHTRLLSWLVLYPLCCFYPLPQKEDFTTTMKRRLKSWGCSHGCSRWSVVQMMTLCRQRLSLVSGGAALLPVVVLLGASEATLVFLQTVISFSCAGR